MVNVPTAAGLCSGSCHSEKFLLCLRGISKPDTTCSSISFRGACMQISFP